MDRESFMKNKCSGETQQNNDKKSSIRSLIGKGSCRRERERERERERDGGEEDGGGGGGCSHQDQTPTFELTK